MSQTTSMQNLKASKRLFFVMILMLSISQVQAQDTLLYVNFQDSALTPFVTIDNDLLPLEATFQGLNGAFNVIPVNGPNDIRAVGVSAFDGGGTADNWLISPAIMVPDQGARLSWRANSLSGEDSRLESYNVWVSTSGNEIADFTELVAEIESESPNQIMRELVLDIYSGSTIYVGIQQNGTDKFALALDDFLVSRSPTGFSGNLVNVSCPRYQDINALSYEAVVTNTGTETMTELTLQMEMGGGMSEQLIIDNISLDPTETGSFVFSQTRDPQNPQRLDFDVRVLTNDGAEIGFSPNHTVIPITNPEVRTLLIEEATSTTCGWCPEGLTEKLLINFLNPNAIVVSIHDQDPMESVVASLGIENIDGFAGYPSLAINRLSSALPGAVSDFIDIEFSTVAVSPASFDFTNTYDPVARQLDLQFEAQALTTMNAEDYRFGLFVVENLVRGTTPDFAQANNFSQAAFDVPLVGLDGVNWQLLPDPVPAEDLIYNDVVRDVIGGYDGIIGSFETLNFQESTSFEVDYILPSIFDDRNIRLVGYIVDAETGEIVSAKQDFLNFVSSTAASSSDVGIDIYPNPASSIMHLSSKSLRAENYIIEIYNMSNQLVTKMSAGPTREGLDVELNVGGLEPGYYTLIINHLEGVIARKISVMK